MDPVLYFVVPCYNESAILSDSSRRLLDIINGLIASKKVSADSKILFVNDGSSDSTWEIIRGLHDENKMFKAISLAHNSGEQYAYLAGITTAAEYADVIITIDCDLQDDPDTAEEMLDYYTRGCDIVYGVRGNRKSDGRLHRLASDSFYKLMTVLGTGLVEQHSQYRLMSRKAVELLKEYRETELFLPGTASNLGLKTATVSYERLPRTAGKTHYSYGKLIRLAINAITSFSRAPLALITGAFLFSLLLTVICLIGLVVGSVRNGCLNMSYVLLTSLWAVSTLVCGSVRIAGGYAYRALFESKKRPRYQISEILD